MAGEGEWPKSDGDVLYASEANDIIYYTPAKRTSMIALNTLYNSVEGGLTEIDYDDMFLDVFSDNTGYKNTVDTGNTTAVYGASLYANGGAINDAHGETMTRQSPNVTGFVGVKIHVINACKLKTVTVESTNGTNVRLYNSAGATLDTKPLTGSYPNKVAEFDYSLTAGTDYYLGSQLGNYPAHRNNSPSYPYNRGNVNFINGCFNGADNADIYEISIVETDITPSNLIVLTNVETIIANPTLFQVYTTSNITGSGEVKVRLSVDNGSTYSPAVDLNTRTAVTGTGTQMILEIQLNGVGAGNYADAKDYCVILWW